MFCRPPPFHKGSLTLVFVIRRSLGDRIIATSEVEKSISMIDTSPDVPFSERGDWNTSAKGSVEYIRKPSVVAIIHQYGGGEFGSQTVQRTYSQEAVILIERYVIDSRHGCG